LLDENLCVADGVKASALIRSVVLATVLGLAPATGQAGPPYVTDDPEPVELGHWEFYLASQHSITRTSAFGTAPHIEVNYGALPGLQLHVIAPLAYAHASGGATYYGVADVELGAKFRFVDENAWRPMVGTFPQFEVPAGSAAKGLGTGRLHVLIPIWLQKSFGAWTTYGGGGYWRNPGQGNRDYWYVGWLVQRRVSDRAALGTELYYTTPDQVGGSANLRFNVGLVLDLTEHHHILLSAGHGLLGDSVLQGYAAYQLTL
jgi:hypothetical protein